MVNKLPWIKIAVAFALAAIVAPSGGVRGGETVTAKPIPQLLPPVPGAKQLKPAPTFQQQQQNSVTLRVAPSEGVPVSYNQSFAPHRTKVDQASLTKIDSTSLKRVETIPRVFIVKQPEPPPPFEDEEDEVGTPENIPPACPVPGADSTATDSETTTDSSSPSSSLNCEQCGQMDCCCPCCKCGPPGCFWFRDEYLGWWTNGDGLPPLVSTTPDGTLPATQTLFGGNSVNRGYRSGNWVQGGMWFDDCRMWGIQTDYLFLGRQSTIFDANSNGDPVLARPFTDANTGDPSQQLIAFPDTVVGSVNVNVNNSFQSYGGTLRHNLCCWSECCENACAEGCTDDCTKNCTSHCNLCFRNQNCCRLDFLGGFRYYQYNDNLAVNERLYSIDQTSGVPVGTQIDVNDTFRALNNFYGGEFGLVLDHYCGRWMYELAGKVGLGNNHQSVYINGTTTASFPGQAPFTADGGVFALATNNGSYARDTFLVIPQFSGRVGYRLTERLTFLVGYTFIYWNQVSRAANQIDTNINPNLIPPVSSGGPAVPTFTFRESNLRLQGISLGLEWYF